MLKGCDACGCASLVLDVEHCVFIELFMRKNSKILVNFFETRMQFFNFLGVPQVLNSVFVCPISTIIWRSAASDALFPLHGQPPGNFTNDAAKRPSTDVCELRSARRLALSKFRRP